VRQIFRRRISELEQSIERYQKESKKLKEKILNEEAAFQTIQEIKTYLNLITNKIALPDYMRIGMWFCFIGYILSVLMSLWWLLDWNKPIMDELLPWSFGIATVAFLLVGVSAIKDIYSVFKEEYESLKSTIKKGKDMLGT
jgi:uncharacterized membrane protein (DUF485 family)